MHNSTFVLDVQIRCIWFWYDISVLYTLFP